MLKLESLLNALRLVLGKYKVLLTPAANSVLGKTVRLPQRAEDGKDVSETNKLMFLLHLQSRHEVAEGKTESEVIQEMRKVIAWEKMHR